MNIGRGLFRLWVVLSALWMAGAVAIVIVDEQLFEPNKTYEIEGRSKERYIVVAPSRVTQEEVVAFAEQNKRNDCTDGKTGPWCAHPLSLRMPAKPWGMAPIYGGIGVPLFALIIGASLFWAFSGFRRTA